MIGDALRRHIPSWRPGCFFTPVHSLRPLSSSALAPISSIIVTRWTLSSSCCSSAFADGIHNVSSPHHRTISLTDGLAMRCKLLLRWRRLTCMSVFRQILNMSVFETSCYSHMATIHMPAEALHKPWYVCIRFVRSRHIHVPVQSSCVLIRFVASDSSEQKP